MIRKRNFVLIAFLILVVIVFAYADWKTTKKKTIGEQVTMDSGDQLIVKIIPLGTTGYILIDEIVPGADLVADVHIHIQATAQ